MFGFYEYLSGQFQSYKIYMLEVDGKVNGNERFKNLERFNV